jgi:hypothetical protein
MGFHVIAVAEGMDHGGFHRVHRKPPDQLSVRAMFMSTTIGTRTGEVVSEPSAFGRDSVSIAPPRSCVGALLAADVDERAAPLGEA